MDRLTNAFLCIFLFLFSFVPVVLHYSNPLIFCFLFGIGLFLLFMVKFKRLDYMTKLFLSALVLRVIAAAVIRTPPESDFALLLDASQRINNGDMSFLDTIYFQKWDYQMGFVFFQSTLLKIWNSVDFLKVVNCFFSAGNTLFIYLIAKEFVSQKSAKIVSVLYCIFPFSVFYVTILSNQFSASFFAYLALYILISKGRMHEYLKYFIVAVLLVLSNVLRPESIIPLLSILLYLMLTIRNDNYKHRLVCFFLLVSSYFLLKLAIGKLFALCNIAPYELSNNDPLWKFVLGFDHRSGGTYSETGNFYTSNKEALALIQDRILQPPHKLLLLFSSKIRTFWCGSDASWVFEPLSESGTHFLGFTFSVSNLGSFVNDCSKKIAFVMYLFLIIGVAAYIKKRNCNPKVLIVINQVFVTFGVYLLIEVQPRYIFHVQLSVFILAALGIDFLINLLKDKKEKLLPYLERKERNRK